MLSNERVRLDPITPRLARAMLVGMPEPDLPWEDASHVSLFFLDFAFAV